MPRIIYTGASEYDRYIESAAWKVKRAERIIVDSGTCTRCGSSDDLQVHHLNYNRLGDEDMEDLRTLCKLCHQKEHGLDPIVKVTFDRGQLSEVGAWAESVRVRAARVHKELEGLFGEFAWNTERDPRMDQVRVLLAEIMATFEEGHAQDVENVTRGMAMRGAA